MSTFEEAVRILRKWQRHYLLREYGPDGHVKPENLELSQCIDVLISEATSEKSDDT